MLLPAEYCVEFAYSMNGHHINTLQLAQIANLDAAVPDIQVEWSRSRKQGKLWLTAQVPVVLRQGYRVGLISSGCIQVALGHHVFCSEKM